MINLHDMQELQEFRLSYRIDKDIEGCELAVSDKAKCIGCEKIIAQGTPRLWVDGELKQAPPDEGIVKIKRFVCHSCSKSLLKSRKKDYLRIIKEGRIAGKKLINQNVIHAKYLMFTKKKEIITKIKNDEIVRELERKDEDNTQ